MEENRHLVFQNTNHLLLLNFINHMTSHYTFADARRKGDEPTNSTETHTQQSLLLKRSDKQHTLTENHQWAKTTKSKKGSLVRQQLRPKTDQ